MESRQAVRTILHRFWSVSFAKAAVVMVLQSQNSAVSACSYVPFRQQGDCARRVSQRAATARPRWVTALRTGRMHGRFRASSIAGRDLSVEVLPADDGCYRRQLPQLDRGFVCPRIAVGDRHPYLGRQTRHAITA